ncbi:MAG: hypothetical protein ACYC6Y_19710, partial [Thermoguttaceae bacterium]
YPDQPWMWKPEWNRGAIPAGARSAMLALWAFAFFWNAISAPVPFMFLEEWAQGNKLALVALLFPLVGAGLAAGAVYATLVWIKYGRTELALRSVPGVIGGDLVGAIRIPRAVEFRDRVKLTLTCLQKTVSQSGDGESTHETVLWQSEHLVGGDQVEVGRQTLVLVVFVIPSACRPTDEESGVFWRLQAAGPTPGLDFQARFDVPVFRTADSRDDVTEESTLDPAAEAERLKEAARASRVHVEELPGGALELDVPPAAFRSAGPFLVLALFTLGWTAAIVLATLFGAPVFVTIGLGLFGLLLWLVMLQQLTGRRRSRVTTESIETASRFLCFWSRQTIAADQVQRVECPVTSQAQQGSRHYAWYSVRVFYRQGDRERHVDLADTLGSKAEAQWIAAAIENALLR